MTVVPAPVFSTQCHGSNGGDSEKSRREEEIRQAAQALGLLAAKQVTARRMEAFCERFDKEMRLLGDKLKAIPPSRVLAPAQDSQSPELTLTQQDLNRLPVAMGQPSPQKGDDSLLQSQDAPQMHEPGQFQPAVGLTASPMRPCSVSFSCSPAEPRRSSFAARSHSFGAQNVPRSHSFAAPLQPFAPAALGTSEVRSRESGVPAPGVTQASTSPLVAANVEVGAVSPIRPARSFQVPYFHEAAIAPKASAATTKLQAARAEAARAAQVAAGAAADAAEAAQRATKAAAAVAAARQRHANATPVQAPGMVQSGSSYCSAPSYYASGTSIAMPLGMSQGTSCVMPSGQQQAMQKSMRPRSQMPQQFVSAASGVATPVRPPGGSSVHMEAIDTKGMTGATGTFYCGTQVMQQAIEQDPRCAVMEEVYKPVTGAKAGRTEASMQDYFSYGRSLVNDFARRVTG